MNSTPITAPSRGDYLSESGVIDVVSTPALARLLPGPRKAAELDGYILQSGKARRRRVRAYEFDLNFPKSISVLTLLADYDAYRPYVRRWVRIGMYILRRLLVADGPLTPRQPVGNWCIGASIIEGLARPANGIADPHLHAHIVFCAQAIDPDTQQKCAIDFAAARSAWPAIHKYIQIRAAHDLAKHGARLLGDAGSFSILSVPEEIEAQFSRRTEEVRAAGLRHNRYRHGAPKLKGVSYTDLAKTWRSNVPDETVRQIADQAKRMGLSRIPQAAWPDVEKEGRSVLEKTLANSVSPDELEVLMQVSGTSLANMSPKRLLRAFAAVANEQSTAPCNNPRVYRFQLRGHTAFASELAVQLVSSVLPCVRSSHGKHHPWMPSSLAVAQTDTKSARVIRSLSESTDSLIILQLPAGAAHWVTKASLIRELGNQNTLRVFLSAPETARHLGGIRTKVFGEDSGKNEMHLADGSILWIEGAESVNPHTLLRYVQVGLEASARLVLSVSPGKRPLKSATGVLSMLRLDAGVAVLGANKIMSKRISDLLENMRFGKGIELNAIPLQDDADLLDAATSKVKEALKGRGTAVVVCGSQEEAAAINRKMGQLQPAEGSVIKTLVGLKGDPSQWSAGDVIVLAKPSSGLKSGAQLRLVSRLKEGLLAQSSTKLTILSPKRAEVFRREECTLAAGDQVRITRRSRRKGLYDVKDGDVRRVLKIGENGSIQLGPSISLPLDFPHLAPFYACPVTDIPARADTLIMLPSALSIVGPEMLARRVRKSVLCLGVDWDSMLQWLEDGMARTLPKELTEAPQAAAEKSTGAETVNPVLETRANQQEQGPSQSSSVRAPIDTPAQSTSVPKKKRLAIHNIRAEEFFGVTGVPSPAQKRKALARRQAQSEPPTEPPSKNIEQKSPGPEPMEQPAKPSSSPNMRIS